jgi:hypothetical protein
MWPAWNMSQAPATYTTRSLGLGTCQSDARGIQYTHATHGAHERHRMRMLTVAVIPTKKIYRTITPSLKAGTSQREQRYHSHT